MGIYYVSGIPYSSDELYHHGIEGQKWGIRRFQDKDGTYTEAGKQRYGVKNDKQAERLAKYQEKQYEKAKQKYSIVDQANSKRNEKLSKKRDEALANNNIKRATRLDNKIKINEQRSKNGKRISDQVLNDIKNLNYKDMKRENRIRGAAIAGSSLVTFGSMATANLTGWIVIGYADPEGMVSSSRERKARRELAN